MNTQIIKLKDGISVEVEQQEGYEDVAGGDEPLPTTFQDQIEPILSKVSESIVNVFDKVNESLEIPQAEVTLNLGFEAGGNVFIAKGKVSTSVSVKLIINKKQ